MCRDRPRWHNRIFLLGRALWLIAALALVQPGCGFSERTEAWTGYFQFTGDGTRHPVYMALTIDARDVRGTAHQPDGTTATVTGMLSDDAYLLQLQPTGESRGDDQAIHYEGERALDRLYGEWSVGGDVQGTLYLQLTELSPEQVLQSGW